MPQIFSNSNSNSNSISLAPGPAPAVAAAAVVSGAPALPPENPGAADFLGQFKAALKSLTNAVTLAHPPLPLAPQLPAVLVPAAEPAPIAADSSDAQPVDHKSETLAELLAALGFVPVPIAFQPPLPLPEKAAAQSGSGGPAAAHAPSGPAQWMQPLPTAAATDAPPPLPNAPTALPELSQLPKAEVQLPMPEVQLAMTPRAHAPQVHALPVQPTVAASAAQLTPIDPSKLAAGTSVTLPAGQVGPPPHQAATPAASAGPMAQLVGNQQQLQQGAFQQGSADDGQHPTSKKTAAIDDSPPVQPATVATEGLLAAAAGSTATNSVGVLPPHIRPSEVVSQIAHQADLYRLPGNRGVRIQLHPEGLGGVEVTMRYGAGGALQLHINVEHAATAALVQGGWTQLRDALATQGISPDRLVMSVSAPSASGQLSFAGGGSGRQTDPDLTGFAQSQSGQQRQANPDQTNQRGGNGAIEPTSPSDDSPRVASTTAVPSRIDYHA